MIELANIGLISSCQFSIPFIYTGKNVGDFFADIVEENKVILELKAQQNIRSEHKAQLINYLKATGMKIGLLINFTHPKAEIKRFIQ